ncbi:MAG: MarR family winged helix-turn-helix transcriptional regulator [Alphaproteobacteria bacterium]
MAAHEWSDDLNPAQRSALDYLGRANDFSRAPSNVADYLCTTRGTASQTLKALERKGFASRRPSTADKRSIRYDITGGGQAALDAPSPLDAILEALPEEQAAQLATLLDTTARRMLKKQGYRPFGVCNTCKHHAQANGQPFCALLQVQLSEIETRQLCHEHDLANR